MATKLIENIDPRTWGLFTGICKMKGVIVGEELTIVLDKYLSKQKIPKK